MRRRPPAALAALAAVGALTLCACTGQTDCSPDESSSTVTVSAAKPGVTGVECWSGCAPGSRDLETTGSGEWTATLAEGEPDQLTLAAHGAAGVIFAQRVKVEWSGCPAAPTEREVVLLRPEGGTGTR